MSISVVFDPLHIRQLQDSLDVETLTQPQIRVLVEEYRDRLLSPTLCVHSAKTRSYLQQFLPDLWARAKVEELLPAYLARTELDIKIGEVVNEVVHSRE